MASVFLWILFTFLFLLFLALILPIRFSASAKYAGYERFNYEFFISYLHPLFFKLLYSSEDGSVINIIGKSFKLKQKKEDESSEDKSYEYSEDSDKKTTEQQDNEPEYSSAEYEEKFDYDGEGVTSQQDEPQKVYEETHEERVPLLNRIQKRIAKIKKSKAYQFLSDAVWRKKMKSWLMRILNGALSVIVLRRLKIWANIGLMDPAALGKLCGYFSAVQSALSLRKRKVSIAIEPRFMKECLEFEIELKGGTSLLRAASCCFTAILTFPYLRTYKIWKQCSKKATVEKRK